MELNHQIDNVRESLRRINRAAGVLKQDPYGVGLSLSQCHALLDLESKGSLKIGDFVSLLNLDKSTVSRQIASLLQAGLVRVQSGPDDKRVKKIELTASGKRLVKVVLAKSNAVALNCFKNLRPKEREEIVEAFIKAADAVDKK